MSVVLFGNAVLMWIDAGNELAQVKAHDILVEANTLKKLDIAPITRRFKGIANAVIKKLKSEMASGNSKAIYKYS